MMIVMVLAIHFTVRRRRKLNPPNNQVTQGVPVTDQRGNVHTLHSVV
jgi:hypothetical protein